MIHRIMVPLDGSADAAEALPVAAALARRLGASLLLTTVHRSPLLLLPGEDPSGILAETDAEQRRAEVAYLEARTRELAEAHGIPVTSEVRDGVPATELARVVRTERIDLVVMTTHGRGGASRLWLGSVADRLTASLTRPVLLLRSGHPVGRMAPFTEGMVVALDGSQRAEAGLRTALEVSAGQGAMHLVHVIAAAETDSLQRRSLYGQRYLRRLALPLREAGRAIATQIAVGSNSASELLGYARERGIGIVAIASQGRRGASRWVMGSVADKIIRSGEVAVLVTRAPGRTGALSAQYRAAIRERG